MEDVPEGRKMLVTEIFENFAPDIGTLLLGILLSLKVCLLLGANRLAPVLGECNLPTCNKGLGEKLF